MSNMEPEKAAPVADPHVEGDIIPDVVKRWKGTPRAQRSKEKPKDEPKDRKDSANLMKFDEELLIGLVDTTSIIPLRSKRTERLQKKSQKKIKKPIHYDLKSLLELPSELLIEILSFLRPSDIFTLLRINQSMRDFIKQNEKPISQAVIRFRFSILTKCFPLPVLLSAVDKSVHAALLSPKHQLRLLIHKRPYQHIKPADQQNTCSCMSCVMAWNNLNLLVDVAHWQNHLSLREPITMISRGGRPQWNEDLVAANASIVDNSIAHPLWYARLLEKHLDTTVRTIIRAAAIYRKQGSPVMDVPASSRLFYLSTDDIAAEADTFLQRMGPPSYEFPYHRDKYYTLGPYLPNRRWDDGKWIYYGDLHDVDIAWTKRMAERELAISSEPDLAQREGYRHSR